MEYNRKFDELKCCMQDFNINVALELLSKKDFIINKCINIINLIGDQLTEDNFKNRPDYFNFWEEHLFKMAQTNEYQFLIYSYLGLINSSNCMLKSAVLIAVTILESMNCSNTVHLKFLLLSLFNNLYEKSDEYLKEILPIVFKHLLKLTKQFQNFQSVLYAFSRFAFLALRAKISRVEFVEIFSSVVYDPFCLLGEVIDGIEYTYLASFYYLYFKSGQTWGPIIYNRCYILEKCLNLALSVFKNDIFGKSFVILMLSKFDVIPSNLLNEECHRVFLMEAGGMTDYNYEFDVKNDAIELLILYLNKLYSDNQYTVLQFGFKKFRNHVKAHLVIAMKNLICLGIQLNDLKCFQGIRLLKLVRLFCHIPRGSKCDVIENKEYILAVITVLYVLYPYNDTSLNMGQAYVDNVIKFVGKVQNAIDYTKVTKKLYDKEVEKKISLNEGGLLKHFLQNKNDISVMQLNLNLLKEKLPNNNGN